MLKTLLLAAALTITGGSLASAQDVWGPYRQEAYGSWYYYNPSADGGIYGAPYRGPVTRGVWGWTGEMNPYLGGPYYRARYVAPARYYGRRRY